MERNNFEASIKALDEIVKSLEKGELSLDEMLALFEKGIALSRACSRLLDEAEKKVNLLIRGANGVEKQEFTGAEGV